MGERLLAFTAEALSGVPHATGAYFLFRGRQPVCAGVAAGGATLRSELGARLRGDFGPNSATHFAWVANGDPLQAYRLQLAAYGRWDLGGNYLRVPFFAQQPGKQVDRHREHDRGDALVGDLRQGLKVS
jgi:hypothetical protein